MAQLESAHTTHMTAADAMGNVVATTQTINNLFGAKIMIPGLGTVPNNYMNLYDPRPGMRCRWRRASASPPRCRR